MNVKGIIMNKQILLALGMIIFIGAVVASSTGAFFSSNASATGNTFAAGTMELKIAQNSGSGTPTGGWLDTQVSPLSFSGMAPGGDPSEGAVWLKNEGSVDGMTVGVEMDNPSATEAGMSPLMRITQMDLDGESLLEGGAGATVREYEEPAGCTVTATTGNLVSTVSGASAGDVVCVDGGTYNPGTLTIAADDVTLVALEGPDSGNPAVINGQIDIDGDGVTVKGLVITNPNAGYAIVAHDVDDFTATDNHIKDVGINLATGSAQGIYIKAVTGSVDGFELAYNRIENIGNTNMLVPGSGSSAKGIFVGDTSPSHGINDVNIHNNVIDTVEVSGVPFGSGGRGAYGVLVNQGGGTTNLVIENNTISNLSGWWEQGVSLYNSTPNAVVRLNDMSDFASGVGSAAGVNLENNTDANSVTIEENNFNSTVATGVLNQTSFAVEAENNWWGGFVTTEVNSGGGSINASNFAGGPFVGLINGNDANGNGYADFEDLYNDPIVSAEIGLDAGEEKLFELGVQLDGPNTSNAYQGAEYETDFVFTLNQI